MKNLFLIALLTISQGFLYGQTKSVDISKIKTISQAEDFVKSNPKLEGSVFAITPGQDLAEISPTIFSKNIGFTFTVSDKTYKIVGVDLLPSFRVAYIYLDGNKYTKDEIDKLRQEIIAKYKSGIRFTELVANYNMDGNKTGDTKWFGEKMMMAEFERAVKDHKKGEIFTVDIPSQNWYHVVLKTHNDTHIKKVTILKVKSSSQH